MKSLNIAILGPRDYPLIATSAIFQLNQNSDIFVLKNPNGIETCPNSCRAYRGVLFI